MIMETLSSVRQGNKKRDCGLRGERGLKSLP